MPLPSIFVSFLATGIPEHFPGFVSLEILGHQFRFAVAHPFILSPLPFREVMQGTLTTFFLIPTTPSSFHPFHFLRAYGSPFLLPPSVE